MFDIDSSVVWIDKSVGYQGEHRQLHIADVDCPPPPYGLNGNRIEIVVSVAERNNHGATLDGVGPRPLSRGLFLLPLLLDGPLDDAVDRRWDFALRGDN
jgi:hypothetical protein